MKESNILHQHSSSYFRSYRDLVNLETKFFFPFFFQIRLEHMNFLFKLSMKKHSFHIAQGVNQI